MEHHDDCIMNNIRKFRNLISKIHANRVSGGRRGGVEAEGWKRVVFALCVVCCTIGFFDLVPYNFTSGTRCGIILTYCRVMVNIPQLWYFPKKFPSFVVRGSRKVSNITIFCTDS